MTQVQVAAMVAALSLLVAGTALTPVPAGAADWITPQEYQSDWVKQIEHELKKEQYKWVFVNDPRTPQASVLRFLNEAAEAYEAGNQAAAQHLVERAIVVLREGVARSYYSMSDIEPLLSAIRQHSPAKV